MDEAEASIPEELGLRLSSLFMFDRLAFVEGPSDEQILRIFADTLGVNLAQAALGFVTTGGARNFTHYATSSTLSFLRKRNVRTLFILDRDERDLADLESLKERVDGYSEVKVLNRRELENYLVCPPALARYIDKKSGGTSKPTDSEIASAIDEACNDLFSMAVERRVLKHACRPVIPRRQEVLKRETISFEESLTSVLNAAKEQLEGLIADLPNAISSATSEVEAEWSRKHELVPGDEVIDRVFSRYGLRFSKKRDAIEIAKIMTPSEIPGDLQDVIRGLIA